MAHTDGLPRIRSRGAGDGGGDASTSAQPTPDEERQRLDRDAAGGSLQRTHAPPHVPEDGRAGLVHEAHDPRRPGRLLQQHVPLLPCLAPHVSPFRRLPRGGSRPDLHSRHPGYRSREAAEVERSQLQGAGPSRKLLEHAREQPDDEGPASVHPCRRGEASGGEPYVGQSQAEGRPEPVRKLLQGPQVPASWEGYRAYQTYGMGERGSTLSISDETGAGDYKLHCPRSRVLPTYLRTNNHHSFPILLKPAEGSCQDYRRRFGRHLNFPAYQ